MRDCKHPEQTSVWFDVLGFILFFWSQNAKICIFECIMIISCCTRDTVYCYHIHLRGSNSMLVRCLPKLYDLFFWLLIRLTQNKTANTFRFLEREPIKIEISNFGSPTTSSDPKYHNFSVILSTESFHLLMQLCCEVFFRLIIDFYL